MEDSDVIKLAILGIFIVLLIGAIATSVYTISAGERGVLLTWGKPGMDAIGEGLHFKFPIAQSVKKIDVKVQKVETTADAVTSDLQQVFTIVALNYHLDAGQSPKLYQEIGIDYADKIISPALQDAVKAVTARYEIEKLTEQRPQIGKDIKEILRERLGKYYIIVDDFSIINFDWSDEYKLSVEDKLTAEQKMLKAQMDLERIQIEAQQTIASATGEAEALRLQKMVITPDLIELRRIEVQRLAIEKWDGQLPSVTGGAMPFLDVLSMPTGGVTIA